MADEEKVYPLRKKEEALLLLLESKKLIEPGDLEDVLSYNPESKKAIVLILGKDNEVLYNIGKDGKKEVKYKLMSGSDVRKAYAISAAFINKEKLDEAGKKLLQEAIESYPGHAENLKKSVEDIVKGSTYHTAIAKGIDKKVKALETAKGDEAVKLKEDLVYSTTLSNIDNDITGAFYFRQIMLREKEKKEEEKKKKLEQEKKDGKKNPESEPEGKNKDMEAAAQAYRLESMAAGNALAAITQDNTSDLRIPHKTATIGTAKTGFKVA